MDIQNQNPDCKLSPCSIHAFSARCELHAAISRQLANRQMMYRICFITTVKIEDVEEKEQVESKKVLSPLKANLIKESRNGLKRKSAYDSRILNKWFLIVTLVNNPNLVPYRKEKSSHRKLNFLSNYSTKIENKKDK